MLSFPGLLLRVTKAGRADQKFGGDCENLQQSDPQEAAPGQPRAVKRRWPLEPRVRFGRQIPALTKLVSQVGHVAAIAGSHCLAQLTAG